MFLNDESLIGIFYSILRIVSLVSFFLKYVDILCLKIDIYCLFMNSVNIKFECIIYFVGCIQFNTFWTLYLYIFLHVELSPDRNILSRFIQKNVSIRWLSCYCKMFILSIYDTRILHVVCALNSYRN